MAKLRREFKEQFDAGVVAHKTGADRDDPHARPHEVKHVSEGDTVKLKSLGRTAVGVIKRKVDENTFEVEVGTMKMKMKVPRSDIADVFVRSASSPVAAARGKGISVTFKEDPNMPTEIKLIRQKVGQATEAIAKFIERELLDGL